MESPRPATRRDRRRPSPRDPWRARRRTRTAEALPKDVERITSSRRPIRVPLRHMADAIQRLVAGGGLQTVFQPIIDGSTGAPVGYEALTRGPERGPFESAAALIAAAASAGISIALERACLESALRNFRGLHLEG